MSGVIAMEGQLNCIVKEYLDYFGFDSTLLKFNEECNQKGKSIANLENRQGSNQKINIMINEMIHLFNQGQRKEFFRRWVENITVDETNEDLNAQKLEFELNVHFAIYYYRKNKDNKIAAKEAMNAFKSFIETKGRVLSQINQYLPYFGLPYCENPQNNFPEVFTEAWLADLQNKLEIFMKESLKLHSQPRLVELYSSQTDSNLGQNNLKKQLNDAEKKAAVLFKKFNKAQADYYTLIGITAELVDSLESTISGKPVPAEYVSSVIARLFNTQMKQSIDLTRPGTAGDYIRRSLAYQKSNLDRNDVQVYLPLNYEKIKHDLIHQNERRQLALLQALRWRLTRAETPEIRQKILSAYTAGDVLNCHERMRYNTFDLIKSANDNVKQYMARFINTLATLNQGRSYLASNYELIKTIHGALKIEKDDTLTKQHLLAALQKLSLRRNLQTIMINDNIIEWLVNLLEQNEDLSDYSLEYAAALFMNLSLRTAGKKRLANDYKNTLKVISELLGNGNTEIRPFINGSLYSILTIPSVKAQAKAMNFQTILEGYLLDGSEDMKRQIEYLIKQINSDNVADDAESDTEDGDEDEEEDPIIMEANLDRNEILLKQAADELVGESLLTTEYSSANENKSKSRMGNDPLNESIVLHRPITPINLRQSILLQTKPFTPNELFNQNNNNNKEKKSDILVIESNDLSVDENYLKLVNNTATKYSNNVPESTSVGFAARPRIQRTPQQTPEPSVTNYKKPTLNTSIQSSSSIQAPKYSITEPRPSSSSVSNSKNSKSSSSSGTIVLENSLASNSSIKKK